jgi:hypothetical protein
VDKYLVSLAFFLLCLECGWLAEDLNLVDLPWLKTSYMSDPHDSLGEIKFIKKNVRRKSNSSLVWEDTHDAQKVFAYDSVLTLDQSAAEINLHNSTVITLHENTLVSIEPLATNDPEGPVRLRFGRGALQAHLGREPASFGAGSWIVEAQPQSKITVRSKGTDEYEIETHGGEAKVIGPTNGAAPQVVKIGQTINIKDQKISEPTAALELQWEEPFDGTRIYTHENSVPVAFAWKDQTPNHVSTIDIYDPDTNKAQEIPTTGQNQTVTMSTGNYSVQLDNNGTTTFARNISIWTAPKIYLLDPLPRQRIRSGKTILLSWTLNSEVSSYVWQISSDKEFKKLITSGETSQNFSDVQSLPVGQYYWRVLGKDEQGFIIPEIYSNPFNILSKPLEAPKLKSPHIIREEESFLFRLWKWILPQAVGDELPYQKKLPKHYKAEFQWGSVEGAVEYHIEMSETPDFRTIVLTAKTESPRYAWKNFKLGSYYWRVAALSEDGELGLFSEVAVADLNSIPQGTITPDGIISKPVSAPTPIPTPKPSQKPMPVPTVNPTPVVPTLPTPEEPVYHPSTYSIELGGHYIYEYFKGSDFTATESGPYMGDARMNMNSPFKEFKKWRGELEFQHVIVKITNSSAFPFQDQGVNYGFNLTLLKQTPDLGGHSWGFAVLNEYSLFQRAGLEDLSIQFPIVAGPVVEWRHNYESHETHYRLGAFLGGALALEARASYVFLIPTSQSLTTTLTFELRGVEGLMTGGSYWGSGTGWFYLGVRW